MKIYVTGQSIAISDGKNSRGLILFPNNKAANKALAWCHKHNFNSLEAADALLCYCNERGAKQISTPFGKWLGALAGRRAYEVTSKDLTKTK